MNESRCGIARVQEGKFKGQWEDDADDAIWAIGYILPTPYREIELTLQNLTIKCISDHNIIIDKLPDEIKRTVNRVHNKYGVGVVKDMGQVFH